MSIPNETLCAPAARLAARRAPGGRRHLFAMAMQDRFAVPSVPIVPIVPIGLGVRSGGRAIPSAPIAAIAPIGPASDHAGAPAGILGERSRLAKSQQ